MARIDLTPMVDVVFLLLIFFMISTTFVKTQGLSIKLPESSMSKVSRQPKDIQVFLSKEGDISLGDERLTLKQYEARLNDYDENMHEVLFLLLADKEAQHGMVVQLMDLAKQAGFRKLAIGTEKKD